MRFLSILTVLTILFAPLGSARAADFYANELVSSTYNILTPSHAVGAPDGLYADFMADETSMTLDMGETEEGLDGLTLYFINLNYGAGARVEFLDAQLQILGTQNTQFDPGATSWTAAYAGTEPFRFVKVSSDFNKQWKLDAVQAVAIRTPGSFEQDPVEEPEVEVPVEEGLAAGELIKSDESSAVYLLGSDGKRHPFPNDTIFFSWSFSFDDVVTISAEDLALYQLGKNVTVKPETYLVKLQTDPRVYAVAPGAELRWVTTETLATSLYGVDWAKRVLDISDVFWTNYTVGNEIEVEADALGWEVESLPF